MIRPLVDDGLPGDRVACLDSRDAVLGLLAVCRVATRWALVVHVYARRILVTGHGFTRRFRAAAFGLPAVLRGTRGGARVAPERLRRRSLVRGGVGMPRRSTRSKSEQGPDGKDERHGGRKQRFSHGLTSPQYTCEAIRASIRGP